MTEQSSSRPYLAAAIAAERENAAKLPEIVAAIGRLGRTKTEALAVTSELAAFDAAEAQAMQAWSLTGEGEPPAGDPEARAVLVEKVSRAQSVALAADNAIASLTAEHHAAIAAADRARLTKTASVARALHDDGLAMLPAIEKAWLDFVEMYARMARTSRLIAELRLQGGHPVEWFGALQSALNPISARIAGTADDARHINMRGHFYSSQIAKFATALGEDAEAQMEMKQ